MIKSLLTKMRPKHGRYESYFQDVQAMIGDHVTIDTLK